jgi:hypothetical protein
MNKTKLNNSSNSRKNKVKLSMDVKFLLPVLIIRSIKFGIRGKIYNKRRKRIKTYLEHPFIVEYREKYLI